MTRSLNGNHRRIASGGRFMYVACFFPPKRASALTEYSKVKFLFSDGFHDIRSHLDLSGEQLIPDLRDRYQPKDPLRLLEYQDLTLQGLAYEEAYSDYWNSTASDDGRHPIREASAWPLKLSGRPDRRRCHHARRPARCCHSGKALPQWQVKWNLHS